MIARTAMRIGPSVAPARYVEREVLGAGGQGVVVRAVDLELGCEVALKVPHAEGLDERRARLFLDGARAGVALDHGGLVAVDEIGTLSDGRPFAVMPLARGATLASELARQRAGESEPWSLARSLAVVREACQALAHAHERGVTHGDVKPSNLMLDERGRALLLDWGTGRERAGAPEIAADVRALTLLMSELLSAPPAGFEDAASGACALRLETARELEAELGRLLDGLPGP